MAQWLFLVPAKGGIGGIVHPPIARKNTTYIPLIILPSAGVYATYHLLREPESETTIDNIAPETLGFEDEFPFGKASCQVLC